MGNPADPVGHCGDSVQFEHALHGGSGYPLGQRLRPLRQPGVALPGEQPRSERAAKSGEREALNQPERVQVATIIERHRAAGLGVEVKTSGRPRTLSPGLDQAAYRIVQESLTNATRHGGGPAEVGVTYGPHDLELTIDNPVAVAAGVGGSNGRLNGGHGILGMRERAALLGGTLEASSSDGNFRVQARLPYTADSRA